MQLKVLIMDAVFLYLKRCNTEFMKILAVFGQYNYGNTSRGLGYEYVNFIPSLKNLGHEVELFDSWDRSKYDNFSSLNKNLLEKIQSFKPDIILFVLFSYEIWSETLKIIRDSTPAFLINWGTDDSWRYEQFSKFVSRNFHLYVTTYQSAKSKSLRDGLSNFYLSQWAANSQKFSKPLPARECQYDVSFVGTCYGSRPKIVSQLKQSGINVRCFGFGWEGGPVSAEEIPQIIRNSVISLNFSDPPSGVTVLLSKTERQIKARIFEVIGSGGFLISQSADQIEFFYQPDKEIVIFECTEELIRKIKWFLERFDLRDSIAVQGYERTVVCHSYENRFREIISSLGLAKLTQKDDEYVIDLNQFNSIAKKHELSWYHYLIKWFLEFPCKLIYGHDRGPRAARRLLYELSWRVVGKKTYSVSGWPGRLFYKES